VFRIRALLITGCLLVPFSVYPSSAYSVTNPTANIPVGTMPICVDPQYSACQNALIYYLDQARADLGLGPYQLPADFLALSDNQQTFILTNLDRIAYNLPPFPV
jgi:hypothetical protein